MSEINPDLHAFPNVLEYPGVGRVQLGAILELEQIEGAIAEAYRAYFAHPVLIARPSATACPNDIATPSAMVASNTRYRMCFSSLSPLERVAARTRVLRVLAELGLTQ